ncbi:MAG: hypothetical protein IPJ21_20105 [Sterolibacteriaceae bacterium]|nr:hypothetical protein [Sterolibacteriaceae bacterium]
MLNNLDPARPTNAPWFSFFVPGMLYGALFEVVALVPLFHLLQRIRHPSSVALAGLGLMLWAVAVILNIAATAEITVAEALPVMPRLMLPGVALVLVFAFVVKHDEPS